MQVGEFTDAIFFIDDFRLSCDYPLVMTTGEYIGNKPIRVGLIGFGVRLRAVLGHMRECSGSDFSVVALYDPEGSAVQKVTALYGSEVEVCGSEEAFFQREDVDWVLIGSCNHLHSQHIVRALEAGKHVFCEKPLATTLKDCLAIKRAVAVSGCTFAFGLVLRYSPFYRAIKEIVGQGALGQILSFEFNETVDFDHGGRRIFSTWRREFDLAGSHLLEKCCHDLDVANWLIGSLPVRVASFGGRDFFNPENAAYVERLGKAPDGRSAYCAPEGSPNTVHPFSAGATIVDNQVAILQYANGVRATFHTNCNAAMRERRFYLCGTEGTLKADAYTGIIEWCRVGYETEVQTIDTKVSGGQGHAGGDRIMAQNLIDSMMQRSVPFASVDDGLRSCAVAFAIDEAMDEGRMVDLAAIWEQCGIDPAAPLPEIAWEAQAEAFAACAPRNG